MISEKDKKTAFRIAYETMNGLDEPTMDVGYWDSMMSKFKKIASENCDNMLLPYLLFGIYDYLENEAKRSGRK